MSEDQEINKEEIQEEQPHTETNTTDSAENTADSEEAQEVKEPTAEEKYAELNDKFLRLYSEFDNYRKRTNKEKIDLIGSASSGVLKDLLPIADDFERAILNNENSEDIEGLKEGFKLIHTKFSSILEAKGLKAMKCKGEVFNSELHEAIANVPAPEKDLVGKVIEDVEKGYFLNDKVVRYAKVVVGQ
jgi:molecular chaperone GrpE